MQIQFTKLLIEASKYTTILDNMQKQQTRDEVALQMRLQVLEQRDSNKMVHKKVKNIEGLLEQSELVQTKVEVR